MFCLPVVDPADYPALLRLMPGAIPPTYEGWLSLAAQWPRVGIVQVPVKPEVFEAMQRAQGRELDLDDLLDFAVFNPWRDPDDGRPARLNRRSYGDKGVLGPVMSWEDLLRSAMGTQKSPAGSEASGA